ncbi:hypothetical protein ACIP5Y_24610 [Nocardia sp. NPDC088792]|uniref:hypothetical protein n=1 Tax=Nocardia sp. NPDC088792 TaxID=3364332 RepID=UPI0037F2732F
MSATGLVIVVLVVVVVAAAALLLRPMLRRRRLREKFGPEYDRAVDAADDRRSGERELIEREHRHADLELRELSPQQKQHYRTQWAGVQQQFVDNPADAMTEADGLVTTMMADRGYPTENYDQQLADLSVEHTAALGHYRTAHDIATQPNGVDVSTEDMRTAIVHYRELFQDLLDDDTPNQKKDAMS